MNKNICTWTNDN